MKNTNKVYYETQRLPLNIFMLFYVYIIFIMVIANLLPVTAFTFFLFLIFGISGICILLIKPSSNILINEELFMLSITLPLKLSLLKLRIKEIIVAEEVEINTHSYLSNYHIKKLKPYYRSYIFKTGKCIKLTMANGKVYVISSRNSDNIIARINSLKQVYKDLDQL